MEAWITPVPGENKVTKALVLARSLRRVLTTRKVVAVISPLISLESQRTLVECFHHVITLEQHFLKDMEERRDFGLVYCFKLILFRKLVCMDPGTIVRRNCDEIFEFDRGDYMARRIGNGFGKTLDLSVVCLVPKFGVFERLHLDIGNVEAWLLKQDCFKELDELYNHSITTRTVATEKFSIGRFSEDILSETGLGKDLKLKGLLESATLTLWRTLEKDDVTDTEKQNDLLDSIAIVGLSCRHGGANDHNELWYMLREGRSSTVPVPKDRWTKERGCKAPAGMESTPGAFLSQPIDEFDGGLFGISPKELEHLDPQQRLLLEVTWEALENACIDPMSLQGTHTGIFLGCWRTNYNTILEKNGSMDFYRNYMGNGIGSAAARLSFHLGLTGPSVSTESGCSSSLVALDLSIRSLRRGETKLALACGVNLILEPFNKETATFIFAEDGKCKTFDENADGFGRAEGCGTLVLKKYSDAIKDGDNIWGLIRGSSYAQEGLSPSMGTPTKEVEAMAMTLALKDAGIQPDQVSFVETHGTGTPVGDPLEISAIAKVYGGCKREQPLILGSVKTNVGHTESCSGITGIIKVLLSMKHEIIPKHLNLTNLNPRIYLDSIPAIIPTQNMPWPKIPGKPRFAGVSSFGITGTDGHLILQEAPEVGTLTEVGIEITERSLHLLKMSAKTRKGLEEMVVQYKKILKEGTGEFADLCYSANTGRADLPYRAVALAHDSSDCLRVLETGRHLTGERPGVKSSEKICFLFPGQGAQFPGMAKELYESSPVFRMNFDKCDTILSFKYKINLKEVMWGTETNELNRTLYSQTSIFCVEYSLLKLWESWGITPDYVLGHSLGEFCAAVAANILTLEEALTLIAERSRMVESLQKGSMVVVRAPVDKVRELLEKAEAKLDFAAVNSNEQTVLAGDVGAIEEFADFCSQKCSIKTHVLESSHAFHSKMMDPILKNYENVVDSLKSKIMNSEATGKEIKYVSGVYGRLLETQEHDILRSSEYWVDHTRERVDFIGACEAIAEEGCKYFLEIGPQPILSALVSVNLSREGRQTDSIYLPSLRKSESNWRTVLTSLGELYVNGSEVKWSGFDKFYSRRKLNSLPTYPFQRKKYWFEVNSGIEDAAFTGPVLHPLLGSVFSNATGQKIFQNVINLKKNVEWVKDHVVGSRVLFPGAGFLEMCLSAGQCTTEGLVEHFRRPSGALSIQNFQILKPLMLEEKESCQVQVLLENSTGGSSEVQVFRQLVLEQELPKWVKHCGALFTPGTVDMDEVQRLRQEFNLEGLKSSCPDSIDTKELYVEFRKVGLNFGPWFQSLEKIRKGENGILAEAKVPQDWRDYVLDPVLLDAMIQAQVVVLSGGQSVSRLLVPVQIKRFTWLEHEYSDLCSGGNFMIYSGSMEIENRQELVSILFDGDQGNILAYMTGLELTETSVETLEYHLDSQVTNLPGLYQEQWYSSVGPNQQRFNLTHIFKEDEFIRKCKPPGQKDHGDPRRILEIDEVCETLVYGYILKAYNDLGWKPTLGQSLTLKELVDNLEIPQKNKKLVRHHMTVLEREGILKFLSDFHFQLTQTLPTPHEADEFIQKSILSLETDSIGKNTVSIYQSCGEELASLLQGKTSALPILFPQDTSKPSVEKFYMEIYPHYGLASKLKNEFKKFLIPIDNIHSSRTLRVLEVGAGTGSLTGTVLEFFTQHGFQLEYTFTDISPSFFKLAKKKFDNYTDSLKFKVLNLETDAKLQGFSPGFYDVIFGGDVVHATKDLLDSLSNLRQLLRPNGILCLMEINCQSHVTFIFGLLEGFWHFTDTEVRQHSPLVSGEKWRELCLKSEFDKALSIPCLRNSYSIVLARATSYEPKTERSIVFNPNGKWLVFSNLEDDESKRIVDNLAIYRPTIVIFKSDTFLEQKDGLEFCINVNEKEHIARIFQSIEERGDHIEGIIYLWSMSQKEKNQKDISKPLLYLCQTLMAWKPPRLPKLLVVTKGVHLIGDHLCLSPSSSTVWGIAKSCANEMDLGIKMIDLCPESEENGKDLLYEIWRESKHNRIAYRKGTRYHARLTKAKVHGKCLNLPQSDRFQLILPQSKAISDLKFGTLGMHALKSDEVEVRRKATGLNFRDVFSVLKPDAQFDQVNGIGADFAGVVTQVGSNVTKWKIGDSVCGCVLDTFSSHARVVEDCLAHIPENLTYAEAATLPAVFATAYHSLVTLAKIRKGDTVLIHTASGGVGLCAIQICRIFGAKIITTAGSSRKRAYLRSIGIQHVFHSRKTGYEKDIMDVTKGQGVDIVLNSLTSPGFKEATLRVCAKNARFIEMSILSIWTSQDVGELRPDVKYTVVYLPSLSRSVWSEIFQTMEKFLEKGVLTPIPYHRFDLMDIREALGYLQNAQHIGKVVCIMPEVTLESGIYSHFTPLFNKRSTYLITGGLGGIGMEVCKWMGRQGASHIVLVDRSRPNDSHSKVINELQAQGTKIFIRSVDIGDFKQCHELMESLGELPPLRGIMHSAGVLNDAALPNQTWDNFLSTFNPKVNGSWNLHELTKNMNLEHFVMFSSTAALGGPQGQSNHAAGCAYLDAMACHRVSVGLPAMTINWGQWGHVGVAAGMEIRGIKPFSPKSGLTALGAVMKSQHTQICIADIDFNILSTMQPQNVTFVQELISPITPTLPGRSVLDKEGFWREMDTVNEENKPNVVRNYLRAILHQILKLDTEEQISDQTTFQQIGLDSLSMIEFKNCLQTILGPRLALDSKHLLEFNNVALLSARLMQDLQEQHSPRPEPDHLHKRPSPEDLNKLLKEDSLLPEEIKPLGPPLQMLSASKTFFVTGVTGNLGPYILKELFHQHPHIEKVYCLVRTSPNPRQRLINHLENTLGGMEGIDPARLIPVMGDLSSDRLALKDELWDKLCSEVEVVIHIAAVVNHVEFYGVNSTREVNVIGTKRVLAFCCEKKTKYLFHTSTALAIASLDEDGGLSQDWPAANEEEGVTVYGYPRSKMIADCLVHQAVKRGLPAKSFRFSILTGHSQTGRFNPRNNHVMMRLLCFMQLGAMPNITLPLLIVPLDISAYTAIKIFLHGKDEFHSDIYNVLHPTPNSELEFPQLAKKFGYEVKVVEYAEFSELFGAEGEQSYLYPLKEVYETEEKYHSLIKHTAFSKWSEHPQPEKFYRVDKVTKVIPDYADKLEDTLEYLWKNLSYAKITGMFEKLSK